MQLLNGCCPGTCKSSTRSTRPHLAQISDRKEIPADRVASLSIINEQGGRRVRMGHLAFIGSHRVNGVSGLHGRLMRETVFHDLDQLYPGRITHVTNGITIRRWLLECNRPLADLITETIGEDWVGDGAQLEKLLPHIQDGGWRQRFMEAKRRNKERLIAAVARQASVKLDPRQHLRRADQAHARIQAPAAERAGDDRVLQRDPRRAAQELGAAGQDLRRQGRRQLSGAPS